MAACAAGGRVRLARKVREPGLRPHLRRRHAGFPQCPHREGAMALREAAALLVGQHPMVMIGGLGQAEQRLQKAVRMRGRQ